MATTADYIAYVCERVAPCGTVRSKKMFGEYMVYVDDKPILLVCDNTVFVKILPATSALLGDADKGCPYAGAKEHYIPDIDDGETMCRVVTALLAVTPLPKPNPAKRK